MKKEEGLNGLHAPLGTYLKARRAKGSRRRGRNASNLWMARRLRVRELRAFRNLVKEVPLLPPRAAGAPKLRRRPAKGA